MTTRKIAILCDGTWQGPEDKSNVYLMSQAIDADHVIYNPGVGDQTTGGWLHSITGGVFGAGADAIVDNLYKQLNEVYRAGDLIYLFGFSRGAAIVRILAMKIYKDGLSEQSYPCIKFLGCWDTVGAFGLPFGIFQKIDLFKDFHVSPSVQYACHAVALHENRQPFEPLLMNKRRGITEMWFEGVHGDIGGGDEGGGRSFIALNWMADQARYRGLKIGPLQQVYMKRPPIHFYKYRPWHRSREIGVLVNDEMTNNPVLYHSSVFD